MKTSDIIRRSGRSLKSAKLRTVLTSLAISVGAFTLTLTLAASNGLRTYTDKLVSSNFDPSELIVGRDKEVANTGAPGGEPQEYDESVGTVQAGGQGAGFQIKRVSLDDVNDLKSKPYIEQVRENFSIPMQYVTTDGQKKYTGAVQAFNPAQKPEIEAGSLPQTGDIVEGGIILPNSYISLFGFSDAKSAVGKKISLSVQKPFSESSLQSILALINGGINDPAAIAQATKPESKDFSFTIVGVSKKSSVSFSVGVQPLLISYQDARKLYDYTTAGTNDYNKFIYVSARIKNGTDPSKIEQAKKMLTDDGYYSIGSKDLQKAITQFVDVLTIMVGVFGLITVIASVFGIVNTQYISVLERTREIGLMKALGMSKGAISRLFSYEATWIGFIGGAFGSLVGYVVGILANPLITRKLNLGEGNSLLEYRPAQMLLLIVVLMLVATIAGLLPARKAARLRPIEALRTE